MTEETVDVVLLEYQEGRLVTLGAGTPVQPNEPVAPTGDLLEDLLDATVRVSASEGIPPAAIEAIREMPVPLAFLATPWLSDSRMIVLRDGVGGCGPFRVRYSSTTGLHVLDLDDRYRELEVQ